MAILARSQRQGESVDEYITDAQSKMTDYHYDNDLQMTLIINGLLPEIKTLVMQHLPFAGLEDLTNKARHIESALKAQATLALPTYMTNMLTSNASMSDTHEALKEHTKSLQHSIDALAEKFEKLTSKMERQTRVPYQTQRSQWPPRRNMNNQEPWQKSWTPPVERQQEPENGSRKPPTCWNCGKIGHIQRHCRAQQPKPNYNEARRARSPNGRFRSPSPAPLGKFKGN